VACGGRAERTCRVGCAVQCSAVQQDSATPNINCMLLKLVTLAAMRKWLAESSKRVSQIQNVKLPEGFPIAVRGSRTQTGADGCPLGLRGTALPRHSKAQRCQGTAMPWHKSPLKWSDVPLPHRRRWAGAGSLELRPALALSREFRRLGSGSVTRQHGDGCTNHTVPCHHWWIRANHTNLH
jgi:hypothetical protein